MLTGKAEIRISTGTSSTGKLVLGGGFSLRSRPAALIKHKVTGIMGWYRQRIKEVIVDEFWPWKAQMMVAAIDARRGSGGSTASPFRGYPRWSRLRKSYITWKKKHYPGAANDFWVKTGRFVSWLEGVASGVGGPSYTAWNKMTAPSSLPYVNYVDQGFTARDGSPVPPRPIFVLTNDDVKQLDKLIKSVIREAVGK